MEDHWKFLGAGGLKSQNFRSKVESLTEISWGMGGGTKNLPQGGVCIFSGTTHLRLVGKSLLAINQ